MAQVSLETLDTNPAALEALLMQVFVPDTDIVKAAEEVLKRFTKRPSSIPALVGQMCSSPHAQARQLATVLLKKKIMNHWVGFTPQNHDEMKRALLTALGAEPERVVRKSMAQLAAKIAKALFVPGQPGWPELLQAIAQSAQHKDEAMRELAFVLLLELTDTTGDALQAHFAALKNLFATALRDPSVRVQTAALCALSALLTYLSQESEVLEFRETVPLAVAAAKACMLRRDDQAVSDMLDALGEMVASPQPLVQPYIADIVHFLLQVLADEQLELGTRASAGHLLSTLADSKPKALAKSGLVPIVLQALVQLVASHKGSAANALFTLQALNDSDEEGGDDDDDEDYDGPSPHSMAQTCLDSMALALPTRYVFPPSVEICRQCCSSPDPSYRKAAAALMGIIAEGCADAVRDNLRDIMPMVLQAARDPDPLVRECGAFCLGQFAEHVQPDILECHADILPAAFGLLDDSSDKVKGIACYVIEQFTENLPPEQLRPYLDHLVRRLVQMMQGESKPAVAQMAVAAMAATAVAAEDAFLPYLDGVVSIVGSMLSLTDEKKLPVRGRALECMGHIAIAVKGEHFRPYVDACMICAVQNVKMDDVDLQDFSYNFFANLARALGPAISPYVPELVPHLLSEVKSAQASPLEAIEEGEGEKKDALAGFAHDEEEDEDEEGGMYLNIRTAELDKTKSAITAIGALAEYAPEAFEPHIEATFTTMSEKLDFWHDEVRCEACESLRHLVTASADAQHVGKPTRGVALALTPATAQVAKATVDALTKVIKEDTDRDIVWKACESLQAVVARLGLVAIVGQLQSLMECLSELFQEKAQCQVLDASDDEDAIEDEDNEGRSLNGQLMEAASDLAGETAKALGPSYIAAFDALLPLLVPAAKGQKTTLERGCAIGCFAEVVEGMGAAAGKYVHDLLPIFKLGLADADFNVQRNSAYGMGVLAVAAGAGLAPHVLDMLQSLAPLFRLPADSKETVAGVVDNAAAAVARLIMACPQVVPLEQVMPVFVSALPLRTDQTENPTVYQCVLTLLAARNPAALAQLPALAGVFAAVLGEKSLVQDEVRADVAAVLRQLAADAGVEQLLASAVSALPDDRRQTILRAISSQAA